jgi:hypothetical protein
MAYPVLTAGLDIGQHFGNDAARVVLAGGGGFGCFFQIFDSHY